MQAGGRWTARRASDAPTSRSVAGAARLLKTAAAGLLLFAVAAPAQGQPAPRPLTLAEAIAMAQQNALAVVQALGQQRTSAADVRVAYAAFLPTLSVSAGAVRQLPSLGASTRIENGQIVSLSDEPWSSSVGLGANLQLFAGGRRIFSVRQARARDSMAQLNLAEQRYATSYAVKQHYFDVLAARESATAARAQLEQAEQQFRAAVARVRARTATRSDSLRSEIQLRGARLAVLDASNALEAANASLTRAVGALEPVTAASEDDPAPAELSLSESELHRLVEQSPAVQQAAAAVDAARAVRGSAWANYLPAINAGYARAGSGPGSSFSGSRFDYSGSLHLSLTLPLFDGLQREAQVTQAQVDEANAAAALRDTRLGALEGLAQALALYRSAKERVVSQMASVAAAEEDLRVQQQRYEVGNSTLLDLLTSQTQLDAARRDLVRARYDQRVAKAQLESLVGRDL
jgi:outer membrane protein